MFESTKDIATQVKEIFNKKDELIPKVELKEFQCPYCDDSFESKVACVDHCKDKHFTQFERDIIHRDPLKLTSGYLTIKTKDSNLLKLEPNAVQQIILAIIKKLKKESKPVRILILKARQTGASTLIEAIVYSYVSMSDGVNALVIADDIKGSNYIFEMQKLFHEQLEVHLKPMIKHSNEKKLEFENIHSQVLIDTAENPNVGRKFTLQYVHLSEAAFFNDLNAIMLGLSQSVPNSPNTMIVMESTANGVGNAFYDRWCEAVKGKSEWKAIFIPWFELKEYSMEVKDRLLYPIENLKFDKAKFLKEEQDLKAKFSLTPEQLNWRRWCIINNCNGELMKFRQEYPSTWEEAFIMSGDLYFDRDSLLKQEEISKVKVSKGFPRVGDIVKLDNKYQFRECEEGRFRLYEYPVRDDQYAVGGDAAEGLVHGDNSAGIVLNKKTNRTAMAYSCQCDTDDFAEDLIKMGHYYNEAMIAPENKGYGTNVCKKVYAHYGNIFRKIRDKTGKLDVTDELGWNTNSASRPQMLGQLREEILECSTELLDVDLLDECRTFINNPKKKRPEAEQGKKDDLIFARAIAGMVRTYYPNVSKRTIEDAKSNYAAGRPILVNQGYGFPST
jgi:hypothetical protein